MYGRRDKRLKEIALFVHSYVMVGLLHEHNRNAIDIFKNIAIFVVKPEKTVF